MGRTWAVLSLFVLAATVAGCSATVKSNVVEMAQRFCVDRGGLVEIIANYGGGDAAVCKDRTVIIIKRDGREQL